MTNEKQREFDENAAFYAFQNEASKWENMRPMFAEEFIIGAHWQFIQDQAIIDQQEARVKELSDALSTIRDYESCDLGKAHCKIKELNEQVYDLRKRLFSTEDKLSAQSKMLETLVGACECLQDQIDSGYDQAGHCANTLAEIKRELGIE